MTLTDQRDRLESLRLDIEERLAEWLDAPHDEAPLARWRGAYSDTEAVREYRNAWRTLRGMEREAMTAKGRAASDDQAEG